jgi:bifunctional non-homologous end joining protein LigD
MPKAKSNSAARAATIQFVEPMYAQLVQQLPEGKDWFYEVKFDGYRCLVGRDTTGVTLWSRRGNDFTAHELYFAGDKATVKFEATSAHNV